MSRDSFILDGVRSPIGVKNGSMIGIRSDDITAQIIEALISRNNALKISI